jgi:hypothetical protein
MPTSVRTASGFVTADARRGSVSAGARTIPLAGIEAVEVTWSDGGGDGGARYRVTLEVRDGAGLELVDEAAAFGEARTVAVEFARECGVLIRDRTLGKAMDRPWQEWAATLKERHAGAPPPRPPSHSPGDEYTYDVDGTAMVFHARPGSFRRLFRHQGPRKKTTAGQWIVGILFLPVIIVLFVPLIPFIALALLFVHVRTGGKGPLLEVSAAGVRLKRLDDEWIPADEIRDVEISWAAGESGDLAARDLVVRSDTARISYGLSSASETEMEWMRRWVRALVCGG